MQRSLAIEVDEPMVYLCGVMYRCWKLFIHVFAFIRMDFMWTLPRGPGLPKISCGWVSENLDVLNCTSPNGSPLFFLNKIIRTGA